MTMPLLRILETKETETMKSREYWQERHMLIENLNNAQGINVKADIDKAFRMAENGIQADIERWYSRIADNNGVSISKARQLLTNRELEELKWDLKDYIKHGEENNLNGKWIKELENASGRWHINRLEALKLRVQQKAEEAFGNEVDSIDKFARDAYLRGYYRTAYEIQKGLGVGWNVGAIDNAAINEIIKKPWCPDGANFSSRIWNRKTQMVDELHREILRTTLLGEHPTKAIDRMLKYVDGSIGNARHAAGRLAMTEAAYFGSKGQQDSFNMLGVEEYEIVATLDNSTSAICQEMDGQHFPMSEFKPGVTAPPFHPYCRTCTCPYFDDKFTEKDIRAARNEEGEVYHVPANMKYEDWAKKFISDSVSEQDKRDFAKYKKILGNNAPPIEEFTKIKYNESEWELFKSFGVSIQKGELSALADFNLYKNISVEMDEKLLGVVTSNGITITGKSNHSIARAIGSIEQRRNGVQVSDVLDALTSKETEVFPIKTMINGRSQKFRNNTVEVSVNPDTGNIIQVNPVHTKRKKVVS